MTLNVENQAVEQLQSLYRCSSGDVRASFSHDEGRAASYYRRYVDFVFRSTAPASGKALLDIGCGSGWSSLLFANLGYETTGVDMDETAFEPSSGHGLTLLE